MRHASVRKFRFLYFFTNVYCKRPLLRPDEAARAELDRKLFGSTPRRGGSSPPATRDSRDEFRHESRARDDRRAPYRDVRPRDHHDRRASARDERPRDDHHRRAPYRDDTRCESRVHDDRRAPYRDVRSRDHHDRRAPARDERPRDDHHRPSGRRAPPRDVRFRDDAHRFEPRRDGHRFESRRHAPDTRRYRSPELSYGAASSSGYDYVRPIRHGYTWSAYLGIRFRVVCAEVWQFLRKCALFTVNQERARPCGFAGNMFAR